MYTYPFSNLYVKFNFSCMQTKFCRSCLVHAEGSDLDRGFEVWKFLV